MFTIIPSDAILRQMNGHTTRFYPFSDWWMAYEQFCRNLINYSAMKADLNKSMMGRCLRGSFFGLLTEIDSPRSTLAHLFKDAGSEFYNGEYLSAIGIKKWADLAKPVPVFGWRPKTFPRPYWFKMTGRSFKKSPNRCHKEANRVIDFGLRFCTYYRRWVATLNYSCGLHDGSLWKIELRQDYREGLDKFAARIDAWIGAQLTTEPLWGGNTCDSYQRATEQYRKYAAIRELFYFPIEEKTVYADRELAELIMTVNRSSVIPDHKFQMTVRRTHTLKRWLKEDAKKTKE